MNAQTLQGRTAGSAGRRTTQVLALAARQSPPLLASRPTACRAHRHHPLLCSFSSEEEDPLLWASTYQAGARLQQLAAARALPPGYSAAALGGAAAATSPAQRYAAAAAAAAAADPRKAAVRGYKAQSARVLEHVDALLAGCEARRQSVVIEGVHLSLRCGPGRVCGCRCRRAAEGGRVDAWLPSAELCWADRPHRHAPAFEHRSRRRVVARLAQRRPPTSSGPHLPLRPRTAPRRSMVVRLMQRHPSAVPFLVHISNEAKHVERFAVRSKAMTLRPDGARRCWWLRPAGAGLRPPLPAPAPVRPSCAPARACIRAVLPALALPLRSVPPGDPPTMPTACGATCRQPVREALSQHPHHPGLPGQVGWVHGCR